jgi:hypothetical protein
MIKVQGGHLDHNLRARRHPELAQNFGHVRLDSCFAYAKLERDLLVQLALSNSLQDPQLLAGERADPARDAVLFLVVSTTTL